MPATTVRTRVKDSDRVAQVRGRFDLPDEDEAHQALTWDLGWAERLADAPWNVGLIVGPSGCGKSTVARALWPDRAARAESLRWPKDQAVVDAFPDAMPINDVVALLSSVGFSSPPAWLRPYPVLSTGQQFRVGLARLLAEADEGTAGTPAEPHVVCDEFTSVVDRTAAQVGSAAVARTARSRNLRFVAVTCHEDVADWLDPDWIYRPAEGTFARRLLQGRPPIPIIIQRCRATAWPLFRNHHYLATSLNPSATCFIAHWNDRPVAFSAWLVHTSFKNARREHRTVVLPDYQGVGMGMAVSSFIASVWTALGYRATSTTSHPAFITARRRSPNWRMHAAPRLPRGGPSNAFRHATMRATASFTYTGPTADVTTARRLLH